MKVGDNNTKFFHNFSRQMKNLNTIWEIKKENGLMDTNQKELESEVVSYFEKKIKAQENLFIIH